LEATLISRAADLPNASKKRLLSTATALAVAATGVLGAPEALKLHAQTQADGPRFETASITLNASGDSRGGCCRIQPGGQVTATNVTLRQLIQSAHQRHIFDNREISGGPPWMGAVRFDVVAKAREDPVFDANGSAPQLWSMLRQLLEDRFKLKLRTESIERPIYSMVVAKSDGAFGPRLRRSDVDCGAVMAMLIKGMPPAKPTCASASYPGRLVVSALPISALASLLAQSVDRVVVDRTGLAGRFDVELEAVEIRPPGPFGPSYRPSDTKQSIFSSVPEQLGLELKSTTGPVEILIVDHAEKPTEGPGK
jgi:uncharacterized protein (TIGR03435 family)